MALWYTLPLRRHPSQHQMRRTNERTQMSAPHTESLGSSEVLPTKKGPFLVTLLWPPVVYPPWKIRSVATPRVRHRARAWVQEGQGEEMRATLLFCFGCSTRDAATELIFLIIHNFRIFYPNNLKFWEKFLCTYMNNFPAGSFLYVELPPITLSLFILKSASEVCSLLCWSDLKT